MKIIMRIVKSAKKWRGQLFIATLTLFFVTAINLVTPLAVRRLLTLIGKDGGGLPADIWIIAAVLLGLYLLRILCQFLNNYCAHIAAWYAVAETRGKLYAHLQTLSMSYYSDKQTGQLMSRVVEDTANFEMLIAHTIPELITSILTLVGVFVILFMVNPVLAALTCIPLPIILFCSVFARKMHKHFARRQVISAELNASLQDNFSGMKEIQIFNREKYETVKITEKAKAHAAQTMKGIFWVSTMHPILNFLSGLGTLIVILAGGLLALQGNIEAADITAFLMYLALFYAPIASFARILEDMQSALVSGKRVFAVMDTKSEIADRPDALEVSQLNGDIEFKNVTFDYTADVAVLNDVSFKAGAGQMIALVGPTGAGKTTITSLMARFYDPTAGEITVDGINTRDMTLASLRNQISMVMQDVFLFNGTIAQNIAYGRADEVSLDEIIAAAKTASVHEFIDGLTDKYETKIGERGVRLSGGQKQRIAIARAVLRQSPILILDEATSAVDNETEKEIQKAINAIAGLRTVIVIAHRLSTVEKADCILFLKDGKIIERGTHQELMALGGLYANMKKY